MNVCQAVLLLINCHFRLSCTQHVARLLHFAIALFQQLVNALLCHELFLVFAVKGCVCDALLFEVGEFTLHRVKLFKHRAVNRKSLERKLQGVDVLTQVFEFLLFAFEFLLTLFVILLCLLHLQVTRFEKHHLFLNLPLNCQSALNVRTALLHLLHGFRQSRRSQIIGHSHVLHLSVGIL